MLGLYRSRRRAVPLLPLRPHRPAWRRGVGRRRLTASAQFNEGAENLKPSLKCRRSNTTIFAGVINGRNIWRNNYATSLSLVDALKQVTANVAVSTASSLLHVPFSTEGETGIPAEDLKHFAFAVQKLDELKEVAALADATEDEKKASAALAANQALFDGTRVAADPAVAERIGKLSDADYVRQPAREERQALQREALGLPLLPTTTIGSFPQTKEIRAERAKLRKGEVTKEAYDEFIKAQIDAVIKKQEEIGLDVLVHGEFERNDMVEYFGQNLNGFLFTKNAWVQSYGTRCVKPPIVWGDVSRANPITVEWSAYAQSKTDHVMKGMLTGPVTILNWSWPREDITHEEQTKQLALAIRDEVLDLEAAGIKVIQIDEAALREKLPLRKSDWHVKYLDWAVPAFPSGALRRQADHPDPHPHVLLRVQRHHPRHRRDGCRRDLLRSLPWRSGGARRHS